MLNNFLSFLGLSSSGLPANQGHRRKRVRYPGLYAEATIGAHTYPVHDWDLAGIAFETAPCTCFAVGTEVQMILKFHFPHETITIGQQARILRSASRGISAAVFSSMPPAARRQFERVLNNHYTRNFLESQVA